jgi:DNA repair exonuclease SbcCD ATPase subunit
MKIVLLKLIIKNFKGIPTMVISFDHETYVYGANGTGKTSIADAWYWLLFGKNSSDEKDFNVKNTVRTELNEMDHEVEGILLIDGEETILRHVYREKHQKKRGATAKAYTGNENEYYWNNVPCQLKDWNAKIEKILNAETFKKITHPGYFCSTISWQKRRETLIEMAGPIPDSEIAGDDVDLLQLLSKMGKKTIVEYRAELAARKKKLKEQLDDIPARIDELKKSLPEEKPNFDAIQIQLNKAAADLNEVDLVLSNKTAAQKKWQDEQSAVQKQIHALNRQYADLQAKLRIELDNQDRNAKADMTTVEGRINNLETAIAQLEKDKSDCERRIKTYDVTLDELRTEWKQVNARQFEYPDFVYNESENTCPHCGQLLPEVDINTRKQTLKDNYDKDREMKLVAFNKAKERDLSDNKGAGLKAVSNKKEVEASLQQINEVIAKKQEEKQTAAQELATLKAQYTAPAPIEERLAEVLKNNKDALSIQAALKAQMAMVKEEPAAEDNAQAKTRKSELTNLISDLNKKLGLKDTIINTNARIENLVENEKMYSQQLADAEGEEFQLLRFEKLRMEQITARVNDKFKYVTFKMFETNINGGEEPCCETMLNGVPYSDLNTAGRIKAGIDVINALSKHYNVYAPIFLDNRESVTAIPYTESQVINFIVSPQDEKLRIETRELAW